MINPADIDKVFESHDIMEIFFHNSGLNGACDDKGHFIYLSDSWEQELGWTKKELFEFNFINELIHPDDKAKSIEAYETNENYQELNPVGFINRYRKKNEEYVWIYWKPWDYDLNNLKLFSGEVITDSEIALRIEKNIENGRGI